nr:MAG TPA: hypothetical protein [Caudoviricetes sp.]
MEPSELRCGISTSHREAEIPQLLFEGLRKQFLPIDNGHKDRDR